LICKGIGHYLRTEQKTVVIDLGLQTNEFIIFESDSIAFIDKKSMRDSLVLHTGDGSIFERTRKTTGRLAQNTVSKIDTSPEAHSRYGEEETRSVRS